MGQPAAVTIVKVAGLASCPSTPVAVTIVKASEGSCGHVSRDMRCTWGPWDSRNLRVKADPRGGACLVSNDAGTAQSFVSNNSLGQGAGALSWRDAAV